MFFIIIIFTFVIASVTEWISFICRFDSCQMLGNIAA
nr:MAG TPA: hypothetical protein [Caudoviricetes sp.]